MKKMAYVEANCGRCGKFFLALIPSHNECFAGYCSEACDKADFLEAAEWLRLEYLARINCN